MRNESRVSLLRFANTVAALALIFAVSVPSAVGAKSKPKIGPTGPTGATGPGVTEIPFGSGIDFCFGPFSGLDSSTVDFMGPGRILENFCNALGADLTPRASDVAMPMTRAGHASNLRIAVVCQNSTDLAAGQQWTFTVENNGAATAVTCATAGPLPASPPFLATCQDTADSAAFSSGDFLSIAIAPLPMGGPANESCVVTGGAVEFGP